MKKTNQFSAKFESKSTHELEEILSSASRYVDEAKGAAKWELEKRLENGKPEVGFQESVPIKGEARYQNFKRSIKSNSSFGFTPKFHQSFKTEIKFELIFAIVVKTFERLEWDVVFSSKDQVEKKRKNSFDSWSEKITVSINQSGELNVKSSSLGSEMWDLGRNSKRVKLFIHVFNEVESEYDSGLLEDLGNEISKQENWDDYELPENLPKPMYMKEPQIFIPILCAIASSIFLASLFAFTIKYLYIILLFESGLGIALAYLLLQGIKFGNYTNYSMIRSIMGFSVIAIAVLTQYFQYLIIMFEHHVKDLTFIQFVQLRLEAGFKFRDINTGWLGWLVVFVIQLVVIYYTCWIRLVLYITNFQFKRVPEEVINFAVYHFVKGKSEVEVKNELSLKGWSDRQSQEYVMEAIGAIQGQQEIRRAE